MLSRVTFVAEGFFEQHEQAQAQLVSQCIVKRHGAFDVKNPHAVGYAYCSA